jgi:hypothetical protein
MFLKIPREHFLPAVETIFVWRRIGTHDIYDRP